MESPVLLKGKVKQGRKRGKSLGFPTANINLHKKIAQGIYISEIILDKKIYPALTFVGNAKTFGEKQVMAENHLLNFKGNIYEKWISVRFLKKIRSNEKFKSVGDLTNQMKKDKKQAERYFKI